MNIKTMLLFLIIFLFYSINIFSEDDVSQAIFEQKCSACHSIDRIVSKKKSNADWKSTIERMRSKKVNHINEDESIIILHYLMQKYGATDIHRAKDAANLSELEKRHVPIVIVNWEEMQKGETIINVEIGSPLHPMEKDHYIKNIELFIGYNSVAKIILKPDDKPIHEFKVKIRGGEHVAVQAECNQHGIWEGGIR
ncbi:hypothetical protein HZA55_07925 [Candidatus Poribacteria bacterium]|nr:hypothetical protein [Candidatus Poribacteria bacterium]